MPSTTGAEDAILDWLAENIGEANFIYKKQYPSFEGTIAFCDNCNGLTEHETCKVIDGRDYCVTCNEQLAGEL